MPKGVLSATQQALHQAIDALGTKPHRLRFLRGDREPDTWKPTQAARALSRLSMDRRYPGWKTLTLANALCASQAEVADQTSLKGSRRAIRPVLVRGERATQALLFCDGSALVGRTVLERNGAASLLFWPGVALVRPDAVKLGKERFARVEALAGTDVIGVQLRIFAEGATLLLPIRDTWDKATDTATRHTGFALLHESVGAVVAHLPAEPVGALEIVGPPGTPIPTDQAAWYNRPQWAGMPSTYPAWLPHRWVEEHTIADRRAKAEEALVWVAIGARADRASFGHPDTWSTDRFRQWTQWRITCQRDGGQSLILPVEGVIGHPDTPQAVRDALHGMALCSEGFFYELGPSERLGSAKPHGLREVIGTPPISAHQKIKAAAAYGPVVAWWPDL